MKYRKVEGDERERLLGSRKTSRVNYQSYLDVLDGLRDGEVVAVEVNDPDGQRGEKIRFSRSASQKGKSLAWLASPSANEIAFMVGPAKVKRPREKRA